MKRLFRFWKVILIDMLGVLCMLAALATGWLPGPGGIPLFIVGLSLLAINHEWAEKYIDLLRRHADKLSDYIFVKDSRVQALYDVLAPLMMAGGVWLLVRHSAIWMVSLGISLSFLGLTCFLGNRDRYRRLKAKIKHKN